MDPLAAVGSYPNVGPLTAPILPHTQPPLTPAIPSSDTTPLVPDSSRLAPTGNVSGGSFAELLRKMVNEVTAKEEKSSEMVTQLLSGQDIPLHQAVIAMEEASVSFQLMVEVRNKLLESYQELMRMQI